MCCWLDFANRLHESISDNDADISPRVPICFLSEGYEVGLCEVVGCGTQVKLKHEWAGVLFGQRDVNSLLKSVEVLTVYNQLAWRSVGNFHLDSKTNTVSWWQSQGSMECLLLRELALQCCHYRHLQFNVVRVWKDIWILAAVAACVMLYFYISDWAFVVRLVHFSCICYRWLSYRTKLCCSVKDDVKIKSKLLIHTIFLLHLRFLLLLQRLRKHVATPLSF